MPDGSILFTALLALSSVSGRPDLPTLTQVQAALNALETCRGQTGPDCPPPYRVYRVHGVRCMRIAPEAEREAVACRVDLSLDYQDPEQNTRHRDTCSRFVRQDNDGTTGWASINIRDRPCEMPSMLARDPHPEPDRAQLERALVRLYTCHDLDGLTDCFVQPTEAHVRSQSCEPISPGEDGRARALCRLSARVDFGRFGRPQRLTDICVELQRFTDVDESPPHWGAMEVVDARRCERR